MADKHEFGSPASVGEYIVRETSKKHLWLAFAIVEAAIMLLHSYSLGTNGASVISIIGVAVAAAAFVLSIINYGTARERILLGKIVQRDGITIKMDTEGNVVSTVKIENIVDRKDE